MIIEPVSGPRQDKERHVVGVEYEVVLEHYLRSWGKQYVVSSFVAHFLNLASMLT